jgi:hypothetical protein
MFKRKERKTNIYKHMSLMDDVMYIIPYILPHMLLRGMYLKEKKRKRILREWLKRLKQIGWVIWKKNKRRWRGAFLQSELHWVASKPWRGKLAAVQARWRPSRGRAK